jgi:hypothetical protein
MPVRLLVHRAAALLILLQVACQHAAGQSRTPAFANPQHVYNDEIGFEYTLIEVNGMLDRAYRRPVERAIAWEVRNHVHKIGLPDARSAHPAQYGVDALGRAFAYDAVGYPYYEVPECDGVRRVYYQPFAQAVALHMREVLDSVDVPAAVREAAHNAVVRGYNGAAEAVEDSQHAVRSAARDAVTHGLNLAGAAPEGTNLDTFQDLIAGGIEDALVEAFNRAAALELPTQDVEVPNESPRRDAARDAWIRTHWGGRVEPDEFERRYGDATLITAGWIVTVAGIQPLRVPDGALLLTRKDSPYFEVWREGRLLCDECRFARYFEDARALSYKEPTKDGNTGP